MLKNYVRIALRNLQKRKAYFILNLFGLFTGVICCLFILHYVSYERSYDRFQPLSSQLFRLRLDISQNGKQQLQSAAVYPAITAAMKKEFSEVESYCRLHAANVTLANNRRQVRFAETKGFYADPAFIHLFTVNVVQHSTTDLLGEPFQILLSETMAKKYFGNENPVGKVLTAKSPSFLQNYHVTGVFKDYAKNSHLNFDFLISYSTYNTMLTHYGYPPFFAENSWEFRDFYAYVLLKKGVDWKQFESKLPAFCNRHINDLPANRINKTRNDLYLTPLKDIHLRAHYFYEPGVNGNAQSVNFLSIIGLFIICIAWMNYINLATARSVERAKEVGVRKVLGALRSELIKQFLTESLLLNTGALLLSLLCFFVFAGRFDLFTGHDTIVYPLLTLSYWQIFILLFIAGSFLSGIYPAFVLSSFNPVIVLKGFFKNSSKGIFLRKTLISLQFVLSIGLIASTIVVYQQLRYMNNQPLGADIAQTLVLQGAVADSDSVYRDAYRAFKDELLRQPGVTKIAASTSVMGKEILWTRDVRRLDVPGAGAIPVYHLGIDNDFIPHYQVRVIAGRNFSDQYGTDNRSVLLNEKAVRLLGFDNAEEAVNKIIKRSGDTVVVAGVVADYHQEGLQKQILPMVFLPMSGARSFYSIKIQSNNFHESIHSIAAIWKNFFPNDAFNYFFLDDAFNQQYRSEYLFQKVFSVFALLSIIMASFGLLGLSAYGVLQRAREISIRKVLGARVSDISFLLVKDFIFLISVALLITVPITFIAMNKWLQNFAYRIDIQWWVFALAGVVAAFMSLAIITWHILRAARANPVKSLRES